MIRVLVADDHPIVRSGIVALLSSAEDVEVVGEAADGGEAVDLAVSLTPDLVLMDLRMPVLDGDEATARILAAAPSVRVIILTTYESDESILTAIEAGASGYLLKAAPQEEILAGIRSVFDRYLRFGTGPTDAIMVNNADWLDELQYIPFLRDYGRHFS
ncbi:MAG: response regulator, partial [Actinomycetota bacterium]